MKNTKIFDEDINPVLEIAEQEDLDTLVSYLKEKFSEGLTGSEVYKAHYPDHTQYADMIAKEIREMGGNSFANSWRGEGPSYHEIVCDVAEKLKAPFNKDRPVNEIEDSILETILKVALEKMSESEKEELLQEMGSKGDMSTGGMTTATLIAIFRTGGFRSFQITVIIANQIAKFILGTRATLWYECSACSCGVSINRTNRVGAYWAMDCCRYSWPFLQSNNSQCYPYCNVRKKLSAMHCYECETLISDTTANFCPECGAKVTE
jgi:Uncharacterized protein conserved in bacteria